MKSAQTIRVRVGLVQTDVEVFDRQGHFVDDLKQNQFELRVDGQPQSISFFELISAGSPHDREIWSKAEGKPVPSTLSAAAGASDAGRTILFFVDDWHMSADSAMRSRTALAKLIDTSMGVHDSAAIFAASGQLGFLQQLTDNKAVLHAALEKLNFLSEGVVDHERPHITEAMAFLVEQNDQGVIGYLANQLPKVPGIDPKKIIRDRAAGVVATAAAIAERSLGALRNLVRSAAALPGRKVIFFLSDGFVLQYHRSDVVSRLMHVTDAAARAGVVIYSLDTRGLMAGLPDPRYSSGIDGDGAIWRIAAFSISGNQDVLNALASDTGGRFLRNTNALDEALITALAEVSRYYMLGWHVDPDSLEQGKYRKIQIAVKGRPDLKVRMRQGWIDLSQLVSNPQNKAGSASPGAGTGTDLLQALQGPFPLTDLPVFLHAGYLYQHSKGLVLSISYQVDTAALASAGGKENAGIRIDVMGAVADRNGRSVNDFRETLSFPAGSAGSSPLGEKKFTHSRMIPLEPGVYQVRVAVRDPQSGRVGSMWQWIDVPSMSLGKVSLSSIFLREQGARGITPGLNASSPDQSQLNIIHRFSTRSHASFLLQIYHAAGPEVQVQTKIYRGNQIAVQPSPKTLKAEEGGGNAEPISYSEELALEGLAPGSYTLEVTVTDRSTNAVARQQVAFQIQ